MAVAPRTNRTRRTSPAIPAGTDSEFLFVSTKGDIRLPSLSSVEPTFNIVKAVRDGDNVGVMLATAENCASAAAMKTIGSLRFGELNKMFEQWAEWSGIHPGESAAS